MVCLGNDQRSVCHFWDCIQVLHFRVLWIAISFSMGSSQIRHQTHISCISRQIGEGNGNPLQYSCLANPMDGGAWWAAVHGVARSWTRLSDFTLFFHFHALEKEMASHSSVLAWRIPGTGEPSGLPSMGSHRAGHDWSDLAAAAGRFLPWKHQGNLHCK